MITVALSASIGARAEHVWRALTDPDLRPAWDERILGEVSLSAASRRNSLPISGQGRCWRFMLGGVPMLLKYDVIASEPGDRHVSRMSIGSMRFDQTLTFFTEDDETGPHTRVGMKLVAHNSIAVFGEIIPRLDVQKLIMEYIDTTLRHVQKYCER